MIHPTLNTTSNRIAVTHQILSLEIDYLYWEKFKILAHFYNQFDVNLK